MSTNHFHIGWTLLNTHQQFTTFAFVPPAQSACVRAFVLVLRVVRYPDLPSTSSSLGLSIGMWRPLDASSPLRWNTMTVRRCWFCVFFNHSYCACIRKIRTVSLLLDRIQYLLQTGRWIPGYTAHLAHVLIIICEQIQCDFELFRSRRLHCRGKQHHRRDDSAIQHSVDEDR